MKDSVGKDKLVLSNINLLLQQTWFFVDIWGKTWPDEASGNIAVDSVWAEFHSNSLTVFISYK